MSIQIQLPCLAAAVAMLVTCSGCVHQQRFVPADQLSASQRRAKDLFAENQNLLSANGQYQQTIGGLEAERQALAEHLGQLDSQLKTADSRIDNLLAERSELKERYERLLKNGQEPMLTGQPGTDAPGFEYDPLTGLNRFPEDVLFELGSAELRPEAIPVLKEFASRVSSGAAAGQRVLIVGHTDDQQIARPSTKAKHATNWHLSTNRANAVVLQLRKLGVPEERMAAMGYSRFQPLEASTSESSRRRNRRVELYLVPSENNVARWDPVGSMQ